jgi:hypothetical protein
VINNQLAHGANGAPNFSFTKAFLTLGYTGDTTHITEMVLQYDRFVEIINLKRFNVTPGEQQLLNEYTEDMDPKLIPTLSQQFEQFGNVSLAQPFPSCRVCRQIKQEGGEITCVCVDGTTLRRHAAASSSMSTCTIT